MSTIIRPRHFTRPIRGRVSNSCQAMRLLFPSRRFRSTLATNRCPRSYPRKKHFYEAYAGAAAFKSPLVSKGTKVLSGGSAGGNERAHCLIKRMTSRTSTASDYAYQWPHCTVPAPLLRQYVPGAQSAPVAQAASAAAMARARVGRLQRKRRRRDSRHRPTSLLISRRCRAYPRQCRLVLPIRFRPRLTRRQILPIMARPCSRTRIPQWLILIRLRRQLAARE